MEEFRLARGSGFAARVARLVVSAALAVLLSGCLAVLSRVSEAPEPAYYALGEQWVARRDTVGRSQCVDSAKVCDILNARYYCRCVLN